MSIVWRTINFSLVCLYFVLIAPLWCDYFRSSTLKPKGGLAQWVSNLRRETQELAQVRTINWLMPTDYKVFWDGSQTGAGADPDKFTPYVLYFKALAEALPAPLSADAHFMLGYSLIQQKDFTAALDHFEESLQVNPAFIWSYYNLAWIHFQKEEWGPAAEGIGRMLAVKPELSGQILLSSKIYTDILRDKPDFDFSKTVAAVYTDALRILIVSQYRLDRGDELRKTLAFARQSGFLSDDFVNFYGVLSTASAPDRQKAEALLSQSADSGGQYYAGRDISARLF